MSRGPRPPISVATVTFAMLATLGLIATPFFVFAGLAARDPASGPVLVAAGVAIGLLSLLVLGMAIVIGLLNKIEWSVRRSHDERAARPAAGVPAVHAPAPDPVLSPLPDGSFRLRGFDRAFQTREEALEALWSAAGRTLEKDR